VEVLGYSDPSWGMGLATECLSGGSLIEGTFMQYNLTRWRWPIKWLNRVIIMADRSKLGKLSRVLKESDCSEPSRRELLALFANPGHDELVPYAKLFSEFILFENYALHLKVNALWLMVQIIRQDQTGRAARQFASKIYLFVTKCCRHAISYSGTCLMSKQPMLSSPFC
jgi:hypothetical protein